MACIILVRDKSYSFSLIFGSFGLSFYYFVGVGRAGIALVTAAKDPQLPRGRLIGLQVETFNPFALEVLML